MRPDASKKLAEAAPKGPNRAVIGGIIAAVVIIGVVVAILVGNSTKSVSANDQVAGASSAAVPAAVNGGKGGGVLVNAATAKSNAPTLDVYEDFQCPVCGKFEKAFGESITAMAKAGEVKLVVHVLSFLDGNLKNDSSVRSANAAACAADAGKFLDYHAAVFAGQPAEEGAGYTDAKLTEFAKTSDITADALKTWQKCVDSGQHKQYVTDVQTTSEKAGVFGTPTVKLDGLDISKTLSTPEALAAAVKAATK